MTTDDTTTTGRAPEPSADTYCPQCGRTLAGQSVGPGATFGHRCMCGWPVTSPEQEIAEASAPEPTDTALSCPFCISRPRMVRMANQVSLTCNCGPRTGFLPSEARAISEWNLHASGGVNQMRRTVEPRTPKIPPADTLTPEQMLEAWRQLLKDGVVVSTATSTDARMDRRDGSTTVWIRGVRRRSQGNDPDPLVAFSRAYRAFQEGTARASE